MKLIDLLKLIHNEAFPPVYSRKDKDIDTRPQTIFNITICFMCEEETWLTCNIQSEILIPWYNCEVSSINPDTDNERSLCVWLKDCEYILENFKDCIEIEEE